MHNNILRLFLFYLFLIKCNSSKKETKQNNTPSLRPINNIPTCQNYNYPLPHHNVPHSIPISVNANKNILLSPLSRSPTCQNMHR
jgi:hypothetical protein